MAALVACVLAGCGSSQQYRDSLSVADVIRDHEKLDGKAVRIRGWVNRCNPYTCGIYASPADDADWIAIGQSDQFDKAVHSFVRPVEAIITGTVHANCFDHRVPGDPKASSRIVCIDRADSIANPKLERVVR